MHPEERSSPVVEPQSYRLHWGDEHPIIDLGSGRDDGPLPGKERRLAAEEALRFPAVVIYGERKSGVGSLLRWWSAVFQKVRRPAVSVRIRAPGANEIHWTSAETSRSKDARSRRDDLRTSIADFFADPGPPSADTLFKALRSEQHLLPLFVSGFDGGEPEKARLIVTHLRAAVELRLPLLAIVVTSAAPLVDPAMLESGFVSVAHQFRVAPFGPEEVGALSSAMADPPGLLTEDAQRALSDLTGGQPLLVDRAMEEIRQGRLKAPGTRADVEKAAHAIRRTPPNVVGIWQKQLTKVLSASLELRRVLQHYVEGNFATPALAARWPPHARERALFISGWVGLDRFGRWGIRSPLHRDWARPVLASVEEMPR